MNKLLQQALLLYLFLFALPVHAIADSLSDAQNAFNAGAKAKAFELYRLSAAQGNARTQYFLGKLYDKGRDVPHDFKEAEKWYRLAAVQGDALAQYSLGFMYFFGKGFPHDYNEAAKWLKLAAEQGNTDAQMNLALMYYQEQGVPQDF